MPDSSDSQSHRPDLATSNGHVTVIAGNGRTNAIGRLVQITSPESLREFLSGHNLPEAWWVGAECSDGHRSNKKWQSTAAIVLDGDYKDADGNKADVPDDKRQMFAEAAREMRPTLWHHTPHGGRLVWLLRSPCTDRVLVKFTAEHLCDQLDALLQGTGFSADRGASTNPVQLYWTPNTTVGDAKRHANVELVSGAVDILDLLPEQKRIEVMLDDAQPEAESATVNRPQEQEPVGEPPFPNFEQAVAAYRRDHPIEFEFGPGGGGAKEQMFAPKTGLPCPVCGSPGGLSLNIDAPDRVFCFSERHAATGVGLKTERGWMFDIVDIRAHKAGLTREEFLRSEGYFDPASVFTDLGPEPDNGAANRLKQRLQFVTAAELASRPRRPDVWARMIPRGGLAVWYGAPKCGKSYLALGLGIAIADGKPFLGRETIVDLVEQTDANGQTVTECVPRRGTVIYVAGEGVGGVADKIAATIGPERMRDPADPFHQHFKILPCMPNLTNRKDVEVVLAEIEKLGVQADVVIVDTVARALGAAALDENSTEDMGKFVAALDQLREHTGAAVLGNHHAGKSGTDRGSSALRGAADVFARVERAGTMISRLVVEDMRDGEPAHPIEVTWGHNQVGEDAHGSLFRLFVARARNVAPGSQIDPAESAELQELEALIRAHGASTRKELQEHLGWARTVTCKRLKRLKDAGRVVAQGFGNKQTYKGASIVHATVDASTMDGQPVASVPSTTPKGVDGGRERGRRQKKNRKPKAGDRGTPAAWKEMMS